MKYLNYTLIIIGAIVAMYATVGKEQNQYILIIGIVLLMLGIYRISKTIPSRRDEQEKNNPENDNLE